MRISLDYDGTFTEDPDLWLSFVRQAKLSGHTVYCITIRTPEEGKEVRHHLLNAVDEIYFTSRQGKMSYCAENYIKVDVWIDDQPYFITGNALDITKE